MEKLQAKIFKISTATEDITFSINVHTIEKDMLEKERKGIQKEYNGGKFKEGEHNREREYQKKTISILSRMVNSNKNLLSCLHDNAKTIGSPRELKYVYTVLSAEQRELKEYIKKRSAIVDNMDKNL